MGKRGRPKNKDKSNQPSAKRQKTEHSDSEKVEDTQTKLATLLDQQPLEVDKDEHLEQKNNVLA